MVYWPRGKQRIRADIGQLYDKMIKCHHIHTYMYNAYIILITTFALQIFCVLHTYRNISIIMRTILALKWWSEVGVCIIHV